MSALKFLGDQTCISDWAPASRISPTEPGHLDPRTIEKPKGHPFKKSTRKPIKRKADQRENKLAVKPAVRRNSKPKSQGAAAQGCGPSLLRVVVGASLQCSCAHPGPGRFRIRSVESKLPAAGGLQRTFAKLSAPGAFQRFRASAPCRPGATWIKVSAPAAAQRQPASDDLRP